MAKFERIQPEEPALEPAPVIADANPEFKPFVVKTLQGLEPVLCEELTALGATHVRPLKRAVEARGDLRMIYRANYELRAALRVLVPVFSFKAFNEKQFYESIREHDWSQYMDVNDTLAIDAVTSSHVFKHSKYTALLAKDAIVDQFRDKYQRRPSINTTAPTLRINVRVHNNQCDLLLDSSGDSLHMRGYRRDTVEAPLNEVLAAGMILFSGWNGQNSFVDPMCGSGTLPIEAAMLGMRIPPQYFREFTFGFTRWKTFDKALWSAVRAEADAKIIQSPDFKVFASDKDSRARNAVSINAMSAGLEKILQIERAPFEKLTPPDQPGVLMMNPPYDERLVLDDHIGYYQNIADRLKKDWSGWTAWIISANQEAMKHFGLRPSRRISLINGALECTFQRFDLYAGTKKGPVIEEEIDPESLEAP